MFFSSLINRISQKKNKNKKKQKKKQIYIYQNNKINKRTDVLISGWTGDNRAPGESVMTRPV